MWDLGENRGCVDNIEGKGPLSSHIVAICVSNFNKVGASLIRGSWLNLNSFQISYQEKRTWNGVCD